MFPLSTFRQSALKTPPMARCVVPWGLYCIHLPKSAKVVRLATGDELPYDSIIPPLVEHVTQEERSYAHAWRRGDVIVWDNRNTLHAPSHFDAGSETRLMWRITMFGDEIAPCPEELEGRLGRNAE